MAAGLISKEEFNEKAEDLYKRSQVLNDDWNYAKVNGDVILRKTLTQQLEYQVPIVDTQKEDIAVDNLDELADSLDDDSDNACLPVHTARMSEALQFEYHVVYSESYSVPVLYLNVTKSDGKMVGLGELWNVIPTSYRERLEEDRWTFLTQQEHPLLGRPFFQLHPCHTETLMSSLQPTQQHTGQVGSTWARNYLISWLSAVGPVVHLKMPLEYGKVT